MSATSRGSAVIGPGAFRLFLALMVFVSHVSIWKIGTAAVVVFLMLSGYWVTTILVNGRYSGTVDFLIGRVLRLWPIVIVCTLIAVALQWTVYGRVIGSPLSTLLFLGVASRGNDTIGTTWSLDVELQFYLLLPLILAGLRMAGARWTPALLVGTVVATVLGVLLARAGIITALLFAPAFATGIWLCLSQWQPSKGGAIASILLMFAALLPYSVLAPKDLQDALAFGVRNFSYGTLLVASLSVPFVAWNVHVRTGSFDRWLGDLSYPFYLVHFPLIFGLRGLMGDVLAMKLAALVASMAAAILINRLLDQPIESWRRRMLLARAAGR